MLNLEEQKKRFVDHIATFTDYGNIKILDFKKPHSSEYRIRFLFEEDYFRLHISGDLGELIATNYNNMRYDRFSVYVNDTGYFEEKIDCSSRLLYRYDEELAREQLIEMIDEADLRDEVIAGERAFDFEEDDDVFFEFVDDVLEFFSETEGITLNGYEKMSKYFPDFFECVSKCGRESTGILDLYMLAFTLAQKQLKERDEDESNRRF